MEEMFKLIESELNIRLPYFYMSALENYPFTPLDDLDCVEDNLVKDSDWIIQSNFDLRRNGFFGRPWPNHLLAIGHDGFGDFLFIDLSVSEGVIYITDHEEEFDLTDITEMELASSMEEYISSCKEEQQDVVKNV
jgi:hypothetical protein